MVLVIALADGVQPGNVRDLVLRRAEPQAAGGRPLVIDPQSAHRIVDGGEDLHRRLAWVDPLELLVNVENATQLLVEVSRGNVRDVEVDAQPILLDRQPFVRADVENLARGNVARHQVAVFRIALFEEVIPLGLGNLLRIARVLRLARHPHAAPFAASAFAHQTQLVGAGNRRRMDLNELAIAVFRAARKARAAALPVQAIDIVERP